MIDFKLKQYMYVFFALLFLMVNTVKSLAVESDFETIKKMGYPYYMGEVIPTPQKVTYHDIFLTLADIKENKMLSCIVVAENPTKLVKVAAESIQQRFLRVLNEKIPIVTGKENYSGYENIITIGGSDLSDALISKHKIKVSKEYPGEQGYVLKRVNRGKQNVIICRGSDPLGDYYAVSSLSQLLTIKNSKILLRGVDITDWPSSKNSRTFGIKIADSETLEWMGKYKSNRFVVVYDIAAPWFKQSPRSKKLVMESCEEAFSVGAVDVGYMINPYSYQHRNRYIKISDPADIKALMDHFRGYLKAGVRKIYLATDDWGPTENREYILKYPEDKARFKTYAESQVFMANAVYNTLSVEYPDLQMYFCPSYYALQHVYGWARTPEIGND